MSNGMSLSIEQFPKFQFDLQRKQHSLYSLLIIDMFGKAEWQVVKR